MFKCVQLNLLFGREIKACYVTQVLKQGSNIKTNCPTHSNKKHALAFIVSVSMHMGQDKNCHEKYVCKI